MLKAKPLVKMNGSIVVSVDFELKSREVQPVICKIQTRAYECCSYAFALPIVVNADSQSSRVPTTWLVGEGFQSHHSHDSVVNDCNQDVRIIRNFCKSFPPNLTRRIGQL